MSIDSDGVASINHGSENARMNVMKRWKKERERKEEENEKKFI